ncbi:MAG: hypothetical protein RJR35_14045 [Thermoanaerobacterales bacterium]|nr:hypothetical protein [Thermoanaerobacterales bacterium]
MKEAAKQGAKLVVLGSENDLTADQAALINPENSVSFLKQVLAAVINGDQAKGEKLKALLKLNKHWLRWYQVMRPGQWLNYMEKLRMR